MPSIAILTAEVLNRCEALGAISDDTDRLTRTFGSPAMRRANDQVGQWMRAAGMTVSEDAVGNLIGRYPSKNDSAETKTFILGSHLDTVRDAGKYDGPLGVLVALACIGSLYAQNIRLPFALEVIGFADEEGVRYQTTYLGSKALAGTLTASDLARTDASGISLTDAIRAFGGNPDELARAKRDPRTLLGYLEVHIEQGPVLEQRDQPVGLVTAIAGQSRVKLAFTGQAGHAGTTPMALRRDALAAAAEFILAVESHAQKIPGLVATVGQINIQPGASNVIPGTATLTLDVRHSDDLVRSDAVNFFETAAQRIASRRELANTWDLVHEASSVPCSRELSALLRSSIEFQVRSKVVELPSGAGHDAAIMGNITPAAMLFVRCRNGLSHHPDESVRVEDVAVAISVTIDFLELLANPSAHAGI